MTCEQHTSNSWSTGDEEDQEQPEVSGPHSVVRQRVDQGSARNEAGSEAGLARYEPEYGEEHCGANDAV